jgi:Fic family protein
MQQIDLAFLKQHQQILDRIREKKAMLDSKRPLPASIVSRIKEELSIEWTYNSNAIEGNSLTLVETRVVLQDGMTVGGKSLREHFEAMNHAKAIDYLEQIVDSSFVLRSIDLLNIHGLIMKNIEDEYAGRIRSGMVRILGANFTPPSPNRLSDLIDELVTFVNENSLGLDTLTLSTIFHHRFVWIHPFFDGNGRTGRLAMNLLLMKDGYPPAIILKNDRKKYYDALNQTNNGRYDKLMLMMLQAVERSLNMYLNALPKSYSEYLPISSIVSEAEVPYGIEYVSLLARTGKINAHKEGRNWLSTKEDVLGYARNNGKIQQE